MPTQATVTPDSTPTYSLATTLFSVYDNLSLLRDTLKPTPDCAGLTLTLRNRHALLGILGAALDELESVDNSFTPALVQQVQKDSTLELNDTTMPGYDIEQVIACVIGTVGLLCALVWPAEIDQPLGSDEPLVLSAAGRAGLHSQLVEACSLLDELANSIYLVAATESENTEEDA